MIYLGRLLSKTEVDQVTGCWNWTASKDTHGYGHLRHKGRIKLAHRLSYELHFGPIPEGMQICHKCDNRICLNPDHLFLGTWRDNMLDKLAKGRQSRTRQFGSANAAAKLSEADIIAIRDARGKILQKELAASYGVDRAHISLIQSGRRWGHIK